MYWTTEYWIPELVMRDHRLSACDGQWRHRRYVNGFHSRMLSALYWESGQHSTVTDNGANIRQHTGETRRLHRFQVRTQFRANAFIWLFLLQRVVFVRGDVSMLVMSRTRLVSL